MAAPRSSLGPADSSPTNATSRSSCRALRTCSTGRSAFGARNARPRRSSVLRRSEPRRRSTRLRRSSLMTMTDCRRGADRRSVPLRRSAHNLVKVTALPRGAAEKVKNGPGEPITKPTICRIVPSKEWLIPGTIHDAALAGRCRRLGSTNRCVTTASDRAPPLGDHRRGAARRNDNDAVWRLAPVIKDFRQFQPTEDGAPSLPTEAKVAYDDQNLYVFVRAFDSHPDSIKKLLARRDVRICCDQIKVVIDSYHDRRTGFEFAVNPAGVKRDYAMYGDDQQEDDAWDGVWEVATQVDSLGWTAEFRFPLSQLRYAHAPSNVFGFAIWRDIDRHGGERVGWPVYRPSKRGFVSQLGDLVGLEGLPAPRRLELAPYAVTKNVPEAGFQHNQKVDGGADIKYGITSNITIDATVNPDFGQVDADPSVVNLTSFETFYQERRPFFVEGTGIFSFPVDCSAVNCGPEGLFYSRRIGHDASRILGAAKISGRLASGLTIGAVEGITKKADLGGTTLEPFTNYGVLRLSQDLRKGQSGFGVMATAVNRNVDQFTQGLRDHAY